MPGSWRFPMPLAVGMAAQMLACTAPSPDRDVEVRDSLGVTIVENGPVKGLPEAFRISPTPSLDLGGSRGNPDHELDPRGPFHNAVRTSDGRYVAVSNRDLKVYDGDGLYVRTIGGPGEGPGEFGHVRAVCVTGGDTIVAIEYGTPRVSVFDPRGEHIRTFNVEGRYINGSGCFEDGSVIVHGQTRANPASDLTAAEAGVLDRLVILRRVAMDGSDLGSPGEFPAGTSNLYFQTIANAIPDGTRLYVGDSRAPEFRVHALDGTLERIVRWSEPLVPVTPEMIDERIRGSIPRNTPESEVQRRLELGRARPQPSTVPVYFNMMVDAADRVWVQDHPVGSRNPQLSPRTSPDESLGADSPARHRIRLWLIRPRTEVRTTRWV